MSYHFAQLDENNIVVYVTPISDENCCEDDGCLSEDCGVNYCVNFYGEGTRWKLTTVCVETVNPDINIGTATTDGGRMIDETTSDSNATPNWFRGNFASIGMTYMSNVATLGVASTDIFIEQQPYPSWSISTSFPAWIPPITEPSLSDDDVDNFRYYEWDESSYQADTNNPKINGWSLISPELPMPIDEDPPDDAPLLEH